MRPLLIGLIFTIQSFPVHCFFYLCALLLLIRPSKVFPIGRLPLSDQSRHNEMLVPINSTSALICEPVFSQGQLGEATEAKWMKDGREIGRVNSHSNAILGTERNVTKSSADQRGSMEPIPKIGFLVISNTLPQDEGEYWCERVHDGQRGERTRLKIAYLTPFLHGQRPTSSATVDQPAEQGQSLLLDCPTTPGVPRPVINWLLNGDRIDFAAQNMQMMPNGSLLINNMSANQSGFFTCEVANFVGRRRHPFKAVTHDDLSAADSSSSSSFLMQCLSAYVRNGVLWLLISCLTISCFVLAYILGALLLYRFYSIHHNRRHRWQRLFLSVAPGFRKTVAPMVEQLAPSSPS